MLVHERKFQHCGYLLLSLTRNKGIKPPRVIFTQQFQRTTGEQSLIMVTVIVSALIATS